ncbi:MAG: lipoyl synthase [Candidatus Omnitrophica bacterium]|nr:lipoyl synthase [Candidatus Omnitrophota bacterium]
MRPAWLNKKISLQNCSVMKRALRDLRVETVCEQAMCPNMGECFARNEATFLILGRSCTRMCSFCNINKSAPIAPDLDEPNRVAQAVRELGLKHVVITSVTRDDLVDGGAGIFAQTVLCVKQKSPNVLIEILIPDFKLSLDALGVVVESGPHIIAHNIETVPSLYRLVRQGANYARSFSLLRTLKKISPTLKTKSGLMLGLGEKEEEVILVMEHLRSVDCDFLSIGQYLAPSKQHYPVKEYVRPAQFDYYKEKGNELGFLHIESAPYVRSSYMAARYLS